MAATIDVPTVPTAGAQLALRLSCLTQATTNSMSLPIDAPRAVLDLLRRWLREGQKSIRQRLEFPTA
jgi:hypothetical protein